VRFLMFYLTKENGERKIKIDFKICLKNPIYKNNSCKLFEKTDSKSVFFISYYKLYYNSKMCRIRYREGWNKENGGSYMAEKELRRLKRRDLLQMLLMQCEETERLQRETDEMREKMAVTLESYERLKKKLDVKDERLNQKDVKITDLIQELEELRAEKEAGEERIQAIEAAFCQFRRMFEEIQRTVEEYMGNSKKRSEKKNPFEIGRIVSIRKKQNAFRNGQPEGSLEQNTAVENKPEKEYGIAASGDIYG